MSSIKDRVLLISKEKGINKVDFFKNLDLSYANFKGVQKKSALSSDAVAKILAKYVDINPAWLVVGEGDMFRSGMDLEKGSSLDQESVNIGDEQDESFGTHVLQRLVTSLEKTVSSQEKTILALERQIQFLEEELVRIKGV